MKFTRIAALLLCISAVISLLPIASAAPKYDTWFQSSYDEIVELDLMPASFVDMDLRQLISRKEFCDFAVNAFEKITGNRLEPTKTDYFTDTTDINIIKAHELGIINGYTDGTFLPGKGITRQEAFQVLLNICTAAGYKPQIPNSSKLYSFSDGTSVASWAADAALVCISHGYVQGDNNNAIRPQASITRQEAMVMLTRCCKGLEEYYLNVVVAPFTVSASSSLNVRKGPDTSTEKLGALSGGTIINANSMGSTGWYRFMYQTANGYQVGYVKGEYLKPYTGTLPTPGSAVASEKAMTIVNHALQYLGYRYVYGGKAPSTGFDCSGLVYYIFGQNGISMNRVADDQMNQGTPVNTDQLLPGDLLFWGYGSYADHVGIYIGNGNFVHASNPKSGVKISAMNETYYARKYLGARRIIS